jgi:hypothetical protein
MYVHMCCVMLCAAFLAGSHLVYVLQSTIKPAFQLVLRLIVNGLWGESSYFCGPVKNQFPRIQFVQMFSFQYTNLLFQNINVKNTEKKGLTKQVAWLKRKDLHEL